jgi:uncharacterized linocin/CFP29 family protein
MAIQTLGGGLISKIPRHFIRNGVIDRRAMYGELVENRTLRPDETRQIEEALTRVARRDLVAVARLRALGLVVPLRHIGVTSYEFDRVAPVDDATQGMSILNLGDRDLVTFTRTSVPVPVTASQFEMDARHQAAGTTTGEPVSLTNVEEHTRAVAEKLEDTLVNGSDVVVGANGLPGYTNFACREQLSYSEDVWTGSLDTGLEACVTDVLAMRTALRDNGFTGPYDLYIPANYDGIIDEDYKPASDRTLRERLLAINGIGAISVLPSLADSNVLLVQMTRSVVQAPVGQDITTVTWDTYGGLATRWAILSVMSFALKCAFARAPLSQGVLPALTEASGIAHLS